MSEMVRHQGIVKKLSTPETAKVVYDTLDYDKKFDEVDENGAPTYMDTDQYTVVRGCIFDVSGAPREYDTENDVNEAVKISDDEYRVHSYFYNGGADFSEMLDKSIPRADKEYVHEFNKKNIIHNALKKADLPELEAMVYIMEFYEAKK